MGGVLKNPWNQSRESRMFNIVYWKKTDILHLNIYIYIYQFSGSLTPQNDKCTLDQPWLAGKSSLRMVFFIFNPSFRGILQVLITRGYGLSHGLSLIPRSCVQIPSWSWKPWSVAWSSLHLFIGRFLAVSLHPIHKNTIVERWIGAMNMDRIIHEISYIYWRIIHERWLRWPIYIYINISGPMFWDWLVKPLYRYTLSSDFRRVNFCGVVSKRKRHYFEVSQN